MKRSLRSICLSVVGILAAGLILGAIGCGSKPPEPSASGYYNGPMKSKAGTPGAPGAKTGAPTADK